MCLVVMLLDLSAAFDTVDHGKLLKMLENEIGITGVALKWFESFLAGRCQKAKLGNYESAEINYKIWGSTRLCTWQASAHLLCSGGAQPPSNFFRGGGGGLFNSRGGGGLFKLNFNRKNNNFF